MKIHKSLSEAMSFLRVTDENGKLSITNIIVCAITVKLMLMPVIDAVVMTGFIMTLLQYGHKRHLSIKKEQNESVKFDLLEEGRRTFEEMASNQTAELHKVQNQVLELTTQLDTVKVQVGFKKGININGDRK